MNSKNTIALLAMFLMGFGGGFFVERALMTGPNDKEIERLQSQINRAKKFFPPILQDIRSVLGIVKELGGDTVVIEITLVNPFDESPQNRIVKIANETKIVRNERRDPAAYQREIADFQKKLQAQSNNPPSVRATPPNEFSQAPATISDIAVGQQISIATDENIRDKESFTAKTIVILPTLPSGVIPQSGAVATSTP